MVEDQTLLVFVASGDKLFMVGLDGKGLEQLVQGCACDELIVDNGWIYYRNSTSNYSLYRVNPESRVPEQLTADSWATNLTLMDEWIYYTSNDGSKMGIARVKKDGTARNVVTNTNYNVFRVKDHRIYFIENGILNRINRDGTGKKAISSGYADGVIGIQDGWVFYDLTGYADFWYTHLYRVREDGSSEKVILEGMIDGFTFINGFLYYNDYKVTDQLFRISKEGGTREIWSGI